MLLRILPFILLLLAFPSVLFAQDATIISIQGQVLVKPTPDGEWSDVQANTVVAPGTRIKTVGDAVCVVAFDAERKNIVTIKDHSEIVIESVVPGKVFLPEGRVFSRIKAVNKNKNFEVRTPTAVSGARGTGWSTEVIGGETTIACFDDVVYVNSFNGAGEMTGQIDLNEGAKVDVQERGVQEGDIKEVPPEARQEWKEVVNVVQKLENTDGKGMGSDGKSQQGPLPPLPPPPGGPKPPDPASKDRMSQEQAANNLPPQEFAGDFGQPVGATKDAQYIQPPPPPPNTAFQDAQKEAKQTLIDKTSTTTTTTTTGTNPNPNYAQCGHSCCPYPSCCQIYTNTPDRMVCYNN